MLARATEVLEATAPGTPEYRHALAEQRRARHEYLTTPAGIAEMDRLAERATGDEAERLRHAADLLRQERADRLAEHGVAQVYRDRIQNADASQRALIATAEQDAAAAEALVDHQRAVLGLLVEGQDSALVEVGEAQKDLDAAEMNDSTIEQARARDRLASAQAAAEDAGEAVAIARQSLEHAAHGARNAARARDLRLATIGAGMDGTYEEYRMPAGEPAARLDGVWRHAPATPGFPHGRLIEATGWRENVDGTRVLVFKDGAEVADGRGEVLVAGLQPAGEQRRVAAA